MAIIKVKTGGITADAVTDALIADDVVGTEHLTANEVDTTALGADAVTGAQLADNAVNSEHYTDGSVDTAHIADAQITTAKLSTAVFTGATDIGADLADADLILVDDGAGGTLRKSAASRLKTYIGQGGVGNAAFFAYLTAHQNVANTTAVTVAFNGELIDTKNGFNTSTYKYTIPSGQGGYWHIGAHIRKHNFKADRSLMILTKNNGATINDIEGGGGTLYGGPSGSVVDELSAGDVIYVAYYHNAGDNKQIYASTATDSCHFWGYKLTV
jgi:hypothetical protein